MKKLTVLIKKKLLVHQLSLLFPYQDLKDSQLDHEFDEVWKTFLPLPTPCPAKISLDKPCREFPNHLVGKTLRRFMEAGWKIVDIFLRHESSSPKMFEARWLEEEKKMAEEKGSTNLETDVTPGTGQIAEDTELINVEADVTRETGSISTVILSDASQKVSKVDTLEPFDPQWGQEDETETLPPLLPDQHSLPTHRRRHPLELQYNKSKAPRNFHGRILQPATCLVFKMRQPRKASADSGLSQI